MTQQTKPRALTIDFDLAKQQFIEGTISEEDCRILRDNLNTVNWWALQEEREKFRLQPLIAELAQRFPIGYGVRMRGGSPVLTIEKIVSSDKISVIWFSDGVLHRDFLRPETLLLPFPIEGEWFLNKRRTALSSTRIPDTGDSERDAEALGPEECRRLLAEWAAKPGRSQAEIDELNKLNKMDS